MMRHRVIADGTDITERIESLTFSNSDPGGYEILQSAALGSLGIRPGAELIVTLGGSHAWHGRVNERGDDDNRGLLRSADGVGYGAKLADRPFSMIYIDRDLKRWTTGPTSVRHAALVGASFAPYPAVVETDTNTGLPALTLPWYLDGKKPINEPFYDAGQGNVAAKIYFDWISTNWGAANVDAQWVFKIISAQEDSLTTTDTLNGGVVLNATTTSGSGYFSATRAFRYFLLQALYTIATSSSPSAQRVLNVRKVAVFGDHGLQLHGAVPGGIYASDIAADAAKRSRGGFELIVADDAPFPVVHYVQYVPVAASEYLDDMAKLQGYHWGVWEPSGFGGRPTLRYQAPPPEATFVVSRRDCSDFKSPSVRYDNCYDVAVVDYVDPAGASGFATVTLPHPDLLPGDTRTLRLNMGVGSAGAATAFGTFALRLSQASTRGGGSATLPAMVSIPGGGFMPSSLLKAGRDRVRITDLGERGRLLQVDTRGVDTFLVRRVETTIQVDGIPQTRIDFDGGVDLLEVLQARLATASVVAGV